MIPPDWIWIIGRVAVDTSLIVLWGCFGFLAAAVPLPLRIAVAGRLSCLSIWCIAILGSGLLAILPAQIAGITGGWHQALEPGTVFAFITLTNSGKAWGVLVTATKLLGLARGVAPHRTGALAALAGLMLASLALTGHTAMNSGSLGGLHAAMAIIHVLSAASWVGGLLAFIFVLAATRDVFLRPHAVVALRRFSRLGHIVVTLVILSGVANVVAVVGYLPTDWQSPYQAKLLTKIGLVVIMTMTALFNCYVLVPHVRKKKGWAERGLVAGAILELALGAVVVSLVANFGTEDPS